MAVLGHLICRTCRERVCLGKWLRHENDEGFGFWRGGTDDRTLGLRALNFLARHVNHHVQILSDGQYDRLGDDEPLHEYRDVEDALRADWPDEAGG